MQRDHLFFGESIQHNFKVVDYARSSLALFAGAAAGILGLQHIYGFLFYGVVSLIMSLAWFLFGTGMKPKEYFTSHEQLWTQGVLSNLSSYVLFWTLAYGVVHVYE